MLHYHWRSAGALLHSSLQDSYCMKCFCPRPGEKSSRGCFAGHLMLSLEVTHAPSSYGSLARTVWSPRAPGTRSARRPWVQGAESRSYLIGSRSGYCTGRRLMCHALVSPQDPSPLVFQREVFSLSQFFRLRVDTTGTIASGKGRETGNVGTL